jgi:hypothetical protein
MSVLTAVKKLFKITWQLQFNFLELQVISFSKESIANVIKIKTYATPDILPFHLYCYMKNRR